MFARFLFLLLAIALLSCSKNNTDNATAPLLKKTVTILAGDTLTTTLDYSGGKVTHILTSRITAGGVVLTSTRFVRTAGGAVEKIIIKNPTYLTSFTSDSIVYAVHHSTADNRYTSMVNNLFFINGNKEYDSTYFTYDGAGNVVLATKVFTDANTTAFKEAERNEFTYSNGNLLKCKNYMLGAFFLEQSVVYDDKVNPMAFGKDWILVGSTRNNRRFEQSSLSNPTTISFHIKQTGNTSTTKMAYTYNGYNTPANRTDTLPDGRVQTVLYYYE
jgi:hypothetical protein